MCFFTRIFNVTSIQIRTYLPCKVEEVQTPIFTRRPSLLPIFANILWSQYSVGNFGSRNQMVVKVPKASDATKFGSHFLIDRKKNSFINQGPFRKVDCMFSSERNLPMKQLLPKSISMISSMGFAWHSCFGAQFQVL